MAGRFEITKAGDGTFSFELFIDDESNEMAFEQPP